MTESTSDNDLLKRDPNFEAELKAEVRRSRAAEISDGATPSQECLDGNIDIAKSMAGYNAYYHPCDLYHGRTNYAVCQHTIDAVVDRKMQLRSECPAAITCGTCPAIRMREREQEEGKALFFVDRRVLMAELEAKRNQPSVVVQLGKAKGAYAGLRTTLPTEESLTKFESSCKQNGSKPEKIKPVKTEEFHADLAGRNLLGDAINNIMGGKQ